MSRADVDTGVAERPQAPRATAKRPARAKPPLSREVVETRILGVLKWITIAFFLIATLFPFYYMVELSIRSIEDLALDPGALWPPAASPSPHSATFCAAPRMAARASCSSCATAA